MKIASTTSGSIVDGPGMRFTVFVQGCRHHCPGCHNPQTHPFDGGREVSVEELHAMFFSDPLITGLTLSGGDPMEQAAECAQLAALAKSGGHNVWTYTGYTYEQLLAEGDPDRLSLLEQTDVPVDGPFILKEKSYDALFRGSRNQRLIDLNATRRTGVLTLWQRPSTLSHFTRPES
jgi:anaerobic ribonucleoside-triphosphate reductase activating protein